MRKWMTVLGIASLLCILPASRGSAQKTEDLMKMDLEDIMGMDVTVFSVQGLTQRQTPGVLTVISREEIEASGSRDLIDVLRLVPGFEFGVDNQSVVSLGVRGNWAQEGKALLMVDGMEMNEMLFSCLALGDHYPVEHLERIEIIRGPGTSFYGGYAELAVINLITKGAVNLNGIETGLKLGRTADARSRESVTVNFGRKFGGLKIKALANAGRSLRSDGRYADMYGNSYSMKDHSDIRPLMLNAALDYRGLKADFLVDRYWYDQQDAYDQVWSIPLGVEFNSLATRLSYDFRLGDQLMLTPRLSYTRQEPWKSIGTEAMETGFYYFNVGERARMNLTLKGGVTESLQIVSGGEFMLDRASVSGATPPDQYFTGGHTSLEYRQYSAFAQVFYPKGNTIPSLGLRYDHHSSFGAELLPWFGLTQILGKWSLKYLFGQTFRAPSIENMNISPDVKPEKTTTHELELGYQARNDWFFIADFFYTAIKHPIVYLYIPETDEESYINDQMKAGSRGIELESKYKADWGYLNLSYSYYKPVTILANYQVPGHPANFLGFPAHKVTLGSSVKISSKFSVGPSLVLAGRRFGYTSTDTNGIPFLHEFHPAALVNLYFHYSNLLNSNWDAGFGMYNLIDTDYPYIQPYNGGHAPLPSLSREFVINLKYRLKW
jgi:outer membrane receptor for ferrienterochelin and colicins